jgi:hypothetical protein
MESEYEFLGDGADVGGIFSESRTGLNTTLVLASGDELPDQGSAHNRSDRPQGVGEVEVG